MKAEINREDNSYILDIVVPKGTVNKEIETLAQQIQPKVRLKGYRDGKVPLNVVRTQFRDTILAEIGTKLLYTSVAETLRENNIRNASNPVLLEEYRPKGKKKYVGKMNFDGSMHFKVTVEAPPEIDVKNYTGVPVNVDSKNFDHWVEKEIKKQQMVFGDKNPVTRPAQKDDEVNVAFTGEIAGESFASEEDFTFQIGEEMFVEGFEESFIGRSPGEEFTVEVTFPENYGSEKLNGQKAIFHAKLHEVFEAVLHPLNDELAQMLSYQNVDEMMSGYKDMWENEFEKPLRSQFFNSIMDSIIKDNPFDAPESWITNEMQLTMKRMGMEQVPTDPQMIASIKNIAERSVKIAFLLDQIYEKEPSIHLTPDDLQKLAEKEGVPHNMTGLEWLDEMRKRGQYEMYVSMQEQQKTIEFLIDNASVEEEKND